MTSTDKLCAELQERRKMGLKKYGVSLDKAGLTSLELLQHAKEEALDLAEYLQALIDLERKPASAALIWPTEAERKRLEPIAQNGNDGDHYDESNRINRY